MVQFCFAGSLKFVRHAGILLDQYVIAGGSADATLYGYLPFRIFRVVRAVFAGTTVLSQEQTTRKQQTDAQQSHTHHGPSLCAIGWQCEQRGCTKSVVRANYLT